MMNNKTIIQITSGRGPAECCWVVAQVLKEILKEGQKSNLEMEVLDREIGQEAGTLFSALIVAKRKVPQNFIKSWEGTILWIGKSFYRKFHKRKNWFIGVYFHNSSPKINFKKNEIIYQTTRASGPGGQHRNKVETAVRATHIPTDISVIASDTRSQLQNKKLATERLKLLIDENHKKLFAKSIETQWQKHNQLERGNPVRTYKEKSFKRTQ